jgi:hypothetical protein
VQRVDGFYLYQVGGQIHPLNDLRAYALPGGHPTNVGEAKTALFVAESALEGLITRSVFRLRTSTQSGHALLNAIRALKAKLDEETDPTKATLVGRLSDYRSHDDF